MSDKILSKKRHTRAAGALTELILEIFRLNGRLLAAGDRLTEDLGLTSARWQVMGALREGSLTVAQIGRNMGLQRQSVQRVVDVLEETRFVELVENPNHRRAKLVRLTVQGKAAYEQLDGRQIVWSNELAAGLDAQQIGAALDLLRHLRARMESTEPA